MLTFKDQPIKLLYDFYAFTRLDEDCKINVFEMETVESLMSPRRIRDVVWAGMLDMHPTLTREQVSRVITFDNMNEFMELAMEAIQEALPKKGKGKK